MFLIGAVSRLCAILGLLILVGGAYADDTNQTCGHYGRSASLRQVTGPVISTGTNWWNLRYIVVQDKNSRCRVFVLTDEISCKTGKDFDAFGRLRSTTDDGYEATFLFFRGTQTTACR